jgi:hypothetical protein
LENQEHMKEKYYQFVRFQTLLCPFARQPETLPSVTQLAALPKDCRLGNILSEKVKSRHLIDPRGKNHFPHFVGCQKKSGMPLRFTYLFRFVITSCELLLAFHHDLISHQTWTRAIHSMSACVLNMVHHENPDQKFVDIR